MFYYDCFVNPVECLKTRLQVPSFVRLKSNIRPKPLTYDMDPQCINISWLQCTCRTKIQKK
ncbi:hypothetical protein HanIR_Chr07g0312371 [Helianthus annuus]|nr:hypothetical protein HanIR_Chr07g0312371 [Helianthus annuus]